MTANTVISPSLLSCDFLNIEAELNHFKNMQNVWLHLDIMDGHFVPNLTFGAPIIKMIAKKTALPLDAHLMVTNPRFHIDLMKDYGIHNITFHIELFDNPESVVELIKYSKQFYKSVGVSIKPKTPISSLTKEILQNIDLLLYMSVEPGFGGQGFIEDSWGRLKEIEQIKSQNGYSFVTQVDGGVSNQNSKKLITLGVSNLVAGSYVFKEGPSQYQNKINSLR